MVAGKSLRIVAEPKPTKSEVESSVSLWPWHEIVGQNGTVEGSANILPMTSRKGEKEMEGGTFLVVRGVTDLTSDNAITPFPPTHTLPKLEGTMR